MIHQGPKLDKCRVRNSILILMANLTYINNLAAIQQIASLVCGIPSPPLSLPDFESLRADADLALKTDPEMKINST